MTRLLFTIFILLVNGATNASRAYENGFPADAGFFPIGVWMQSPANAAEFRSIGINTYVGVSGGVSDPALAEIAKQGMFVIASDGSRSFTGPGRRTIRAWLQPDEPDDAQPLASGKHGPCIPAAEVAGRTRSISRADPTRPVMINFGPGVADTLWVGRGSCLGDSKYYSEAIQGAGIISFDIYPISSDVGRVKGRLEYVARGTQSLVATIHPGQSVWAVIETSALDPLHQVTPKQLRAEVWLALIHGAKGIVYFCHEWQPGFREDAIFRHPATVEEAKKTDARISALARVLNSPSVPVHVSVSSKISIATMLKASGDDLYLFTVGMDSAAGSASISLSGVGEGVATVLDEDRRIRLVGGVLHDSFSAYGVHLYRISGVRPGPPAR